MSGERPAPALRLLTAPLDALWRLSVAPSTAAVLTALAAAAIALGLALPQAPRNVTGDPPALERWLAGLQMQHGAWVSWPARVGLFSLHTSPSFRLLWATLGFAALVATADSILAWRERVAGKGIPWHLLAHLGLLLLLVGALVEERWGWEQERLLVGTGSPVAVGPAADALYLERLEPGTAKPGGVPLLWRRGKAQGQAELRPGRPLALGLTTLHLQHAGPAVRLRVMAASGQAMLLDDPSAGGQLQPEATLRFRQAGESRYVSVPARDWVIRLAHQSAAMGGSPFTLWVYRGLEAVPLAQAPLAAGSELAIGELRLRWQILPYVELRAALHPGLGLWIGGWLLLCLGLGISRAKGGPAYYQSTPYGRDPALPLGGKGVAVPGHSAVASLRWVWIPATVGLGSTIWLAAGGLRQAGAHLPATIGPLAAASLWLLAWAAAALLLGALAALLAGLGRSVPALDVWPASLGWGLLAWTVGGGLMVLAGWAAEGTLWYWEPRQAWWALTWCLLVAAWHLRGSPRRWLLPASLGLAAALATFVVLIGPLAGVSGLVST